MVADYDEAFFGADGLATLDAVVDCNAADRAQPFAGERIGAPIARPHQILCIGLNYSDHAAETGQTGAGRADPVHQVAQQHGGS